MTKKIILFSLSSIIIIISVLFGYYYFIKDKQTVSSQTLNAVPIDAAIVFQSNDVASFLNDLTSKNQVWKELQSIESFAKLNSNILFLDSISEKYSFVKEKITKTPLIISTHIVGKSKFEFLFLLSLNNEVEYDNLQSTIKDIVKNSGVISERTYNQEKIYDVKISNGNNFSYTYSKGVFMFSYSSILVEDALRQVNSDISFLSDGNFVKVSNTAGKNVAANVYVNFKMFPKLASAFLNQDNKAYINSFTNFANWAELDLTMKEDAFMLNGFSYSNDSSNHFLNIFNSETAQSFDFESVLPSNTSLFCALGFDDAKNYNEKFKSYLDKEGKLSTQKKQINKLIESQNINLEKIFIDLIDNEAILAYTDINSLDVNQNLFALIKVNSRSSSEEKMIEVLKDVAYKNNREFSSYINVCDIDEESKFPIYESPIQYIPSNLFGSIFSEVNGKYFTFIENYMIFSNSVAAISGFIHANILQKTLRSDLNYIKFKDYLSAKSNFYFYMNTSRSLKLISGFMDKEMVSDIEKYTNTLQKFQAIAFQFSASKNMIYNNFVLKYNPVYKEPPRTVWECHLDTNSTFKPKLVVNHNTKEKEIFVQDLNKNIYLINENGRKLWQKKLDEEIISDVYQVDFYKNGKLQYLFNTKSRIYMLDRNGNHVERYPVNLSSNATNGISVFDYENNRDYRIFIATEDKKISLYTADGNIVTGWEFDKTESLVKNEIQHFKVEDKDFIVFADDLNIYILDRKGSSRIKPKEQFPRSKNNVFILENATKIEEARLVTTDTSGNIMRIKLNGEVEKMNIEYCSSSHYFDYQDVDSDGKRDYIFTDNNKLEVYNYKKELLFKQSFEDETPLKPSYYYFASNDRKIGITSEKESKIFLFNFDGSLYDGFPLRGKTLFSIGLFNNSNSKFNLIVGSDNNFLYNYEVN